MDFVIEIVEENANVFESRWKKFSDEKCAFLTLIEEVGELSTSLKGNPDGHSPQSELIQIAGICINWLRQYDEETLMKALRIANHET